MTDYTNKPPVRGDVFCAVEVQHHPLAPLWHRFLEALYLRKSQGPSYTVMANYRLVTEVRQDKVFFLNGAGHAQAEWLSEWLDWQCEAVQLVHAGHAMSSKFIQEQTGSAELPFDLTNYQPKESFSNE